jgi:hypothetical protein
MSSSAERAFHSIATPDAQSFQVTEGVNSWRAIRETVQKFNKAELTHFYGACLEALTQEDATWTQDRRDVVLTVLGDLPLDRMGQIDVWYAMRDSLYKIKTTQYGSSNGAVSDVLAAAEIVGPHLLARPELETYFKSVRMNLESRFPREAKNIGYQIDRILASLPAQSAPLFTDEDFGLDVKERLGGRTGPSLRSDQQALLTLYKSHAKSEGTFKLALHAATPAYESVAASIGIDLARFWNLHDPNKIAISIKNAMKNLATKAVIDRVCKQVFHTPLSEFTHRSLAMVTDELVEGVQKEVRVMTAASHIRFATQAEGLKRHVSLSSVQSESAKKRCLNQWQEFFIKYGKPTMVPSTFDQLQKSAYNAQVLDMLETKYELSQAEKRNVVQKLRRLFPDRMVPDDYRLMSRTENDLYLGDQTGDCTSWHLETGTNAWTVPIWNSHPGFNQFMILDGHALVAKMGLFIAVENRKPVLLIDSMEKGGQVEDTPVNRRKILSGVEYLQTWALRQGFIRMDITRASNDDEFFDTFLAQYISDGDRESRVQILNGVRPITDLRLHFKLQRPKREKIYIQSLEGVVNDVNRSAEYALMRELEEVVNETITILPNDKQEAFRDSLTQADWKTVFSTIFSTRFPRMSYVFGSNLKEWKTYLQSSLYDSRAVGMDTCKMFFKDFRLYPEALDVFNGTMSGLAEYSSDAVLSQIPKYNQQIHGETLEEEAVSADNFMDMMVSMYKQHEFSPTTALKRLYAGKEVATADDMPLERGIPRLFIPS